MACAREERWLRSAAFTTMARVNILSAPSTFVIGPWIWLQIYLEQCLVCRVKSSLAFVKLPPLLLRNCSHLYLKDESPGGPRGPATGAGVCGGYGAGGQGRGTAGSWAVETKLLSDELDLEGLSPAGCTWQLRGLGCHRIFSLGSPRSPSAFYQRTGWGQSRQSPVCTFVNPTL